LRPVRCASWRKVTWSVGLAAVGVELEEEDEEDELDAELFDVAGEEEELDADELGDAEELDDAEALVDSEALADAEELDDSEGSSAPDEPPPQATNRAPTSPIPKRLTLTCIATPHTR